MKVDKIYLCRYNVNVYLLLLCFYVPVYENNVYTLDICLREFSECRIQFYIYLPLKKFCNIYVYNIYTCIY